MKLSAQTLEEAFGEKHSWCCPQISDLFLTYQKYQKLLHLISQKTNACPSKWLDYLESIFFLLTSSNNNKIYYQYSQSKQYNIYYSNIAMYLLKTVQIF